MNALRGRIEQNIIFQFFATFLCSLQLFISSLISKGSNNKYVVGSVVIILGSVYPLILKYTKNGQSKYPFMIGVAVCVKNIFMLIYYFARYMTWLYSPENKRVESYEHMMTDTDNDNDTMSPYSSDYDGDHDHDIDNIDPNSSLHPSHHHYSIDNTSHQFSPQFAKRIDNKDNIKTTLKIDVTHHAQSSPISPTSSHTHSTSKAMMNLLGSTPSKISWALSVLKSPNKSNKLKTKNSSSSLHKLAKSSSEMETLSKPDMEPIEMNTISMDNDEDINNSDIASSVASKQRKIVSTLSPVHSIKDKLKYCCELKWSDIRHRLKLYCYLAPNALLVLINDILALYTLSFVSVATYAVFMQVTILFIVMVRYFCLNKAIKKSQLLSVCISVFGMIVFELVELEPKIVSSSKSVLADDDAKSDMIGIGLCMVRGIFKACDLVYVEWFIHHLNEIPFYEKQAVVSVWFVVCSFLYVVLYHGQDIFINGRYIFDGFNDITWIFVGYGTFFALMIYLLILRLDSMVMGFCQQMTVLFAVSLDVIIFHTKVTGSMWVAALIVVIAIIQYSVIQYEFMEVDKINKKMQLQIIRRNESKSLINNDHKERNNHQRQRKYQRNDNVLIDDDSNDDEQDDDDLSDNDQIDNHQD